MDPNETLRQMRELAEKIHAADHTDASECPDELNEYFILAEELDEWITKGGFIPRAWEQAAL